MPPTPAKPPTSAPDPVEKALTLRTKQAEAEKAEAEALAAKVTARRSLFNAGSEMKGMTGEVTLPGQTVVANIVIRNALFEAAKTMADQVAATLNTTSKQNELVLILYDKASLDLVAVYTAINEQLNVLQGSFDAGIESFEGIIANAQNLIREATPPAAAGVQAQAVNQFYALAIDPITPLAILGLTKTAAEIVGFFKTNTTITAEEVTVTSTDFVTLFVEALRQNKNIADAYGTLKFYWPAIVLPAIPVTSPLSGRYTDLARQAEQARRLSTGVEPVVTALQSLAADGKNPKLADLLSMVDDLEKGRTRIDALVAVFDALSKQLLESTATASVLSQLVQIEPLKQLLDGPGVFLVKVDLSAKAERRVRRWAWSNDRLEYGAGIWASAQFFDRQGALWRTFHTNVVKPYTKTDLIFR